MQRCLLRVGFFALNLFVISSMSLPLSANAAPPCPGPTEMKAEHLFGHWIAQFSTPPHGLPARASLLLERHAEFSDSLAGTVNRELAAAPAAMPAGHAASAALAGDLEDGVLILDESSDRISITGTWNAEMVKGSCGQEFTGHWKDTSRAAPADAPDLPFRLTRRP